MAGMQTRTMVIAFIDLTDYARQTARVGDDEVASTIDAWYELVGDVVGVAHIVKLIGDGALLAWDGDAAAEAVTALLDLAGRAESWFAQRGWPCKLVAKVNVGPVVAGDYGARGAKRFDILGANVNATALIRGAPGVTLSATAHAALPAAMQARFVARALTYVSA
jgi:adenylate cyclase